MTTVNAMCADKPKIIKIGNSKKEGSSKSMSALNDITTQTVPVKLKHSGIKRSSSKKSKASVRKPSKTQEKKTKMMLQREHDNIPLSAPFVNEEIEEDRGHEFNAEDLNKLRKMWELPAICHILWLLQDPLKLPFSARLLDYEIALMKPTNSTLLDNIITTLLATESKGTKAISFESGVKLRYEFWSRHLAERYKRKYHDWHTQFVDPNASPASRTSEQAEKNSDSSFFPHKCTLSYLGAQCPFKDASFADLTIEMRCKVLYNLCEAIVNDTKNINYLQQMEEDDLRIEPLGFDRVGNAYYFFTEFYHDRRIYRLESNGEAWDLWARGEHSFREMLKKLEHMRGRKARGEQDLIEHMRVIIEQYEAEDKVHAKQVELANRKAILDAMPRKKSLRLRAKNMARAAVERTVKSP